MPHAIICRGCGHMAPSSPCPTCKPKMAKRPRARTRASSAFYQTPEWRRLRAQARKIYKECAICPSTKRLTMHHIIPRDEGGPDTIENLMPLCGKHHSQYEFDIKAGRQSTVRALVEEAMKHHTTPSF